MPGELLLKRIEPEQEGLERPFDEVGADGGPVDGGIALHALVRDHAQPRLLEPFAASQQALAPGEWRRDAASHRIRLYLDDAHRHPTVAPAVSPRTRPRWTTISTTSTGAAAIIVASASSGWVMAN